MSLWYKQNQVKEMNYKRISGPISATQWWGYGWRPWWTDKANPEFRTVN